MLVSCREGYVNPLEGTGIPRTEMATPVEGIPSEGTGEDKRIDSMMTSIHPDRAGEGMRPNKQCLKLKGHSEHSEELFPRLPDTITLSQIVPKLPWRAFYILAAVSQTWRRAIQDHRVHDARIRSCSSDTLVVHGHNYDTGDYQIDGANCSQRIAVYSFRDKICYDLPPIPGHSKGVPLFCQCVSLDGKIYVLGGQFDIRSDSARCSNGSRKVYVLDLAGASHWKKCASMERGRSDFGCAVLNGKIYVFGGISNGGPVRRAEVYNPKVNAWSPIAPMISLGFGCRVSIMTEEFFTHSGTYFHPSYLRWRANGGRKSDLQREPFPFMDLTSSMEAYNPVKDEWRADNRFGELDCERRDYGSLFVAQGKFHLMAEDDISVLEDDGSWTVLKQSDFLGRYFGSTSVKRTVVVDLKNELLAAIDWYHEDQSDEDDDPPGIYHSEGFNSENKKLIWNIVSRCPLVFYYMHCIQV